MYKYDYYGNEIFHKRLDYTSKHTICWTDSIRYYYLYLNGKIVKEEINDSLNIIKYTYNKQGKIIAKYYEQKLDSVTLRHYEVPHIHYLHAKNNSIVKYGLDGYVRKCDTFKYDQLGRKIEYKKIYVLSESDTNGAVASVTRYEYNDNGQLVQEINSGVYSHKDTIIYAYDNNGFVASKRHTPFQYEYINDENGLILKERMKVICNSKIHKETDYVYTFWRQ